MCPRSRPPLVSSLAQQREKVTAELGEGKHPGRADQRDPTPEPGQRQQHRYIAVNASFCRFFGNRIEDILGKTDYDFFAPEDAAYYQETDLRALAGSPPVEYEHRYTVSAGKRWMLVRKSALTRPDGTRVVVLVLIDVTERRAADELLRASEQRFRSLTELSADWYWEQDAQLRFTFFSDRGGGKTVTPTSELIGKTRLEIDIEWESEAAREQHGQALTARLPFKDLLFRDVKSGRWALVSGEPVFDAWGTFTGYRGVGRDMTANKLAQQRIARLKDMYAAMSEANGVIVHSSDQQALFDAICRIAVEYVHFAYVRVALLDFTTGLAEIVATAGDDKGRLPRVAASLDPGTREGQGLSSHALRTGTNVVCNDVSTEPRTEPWRELLAALGIRSIAAFVLRCQSKVAGTLHFYAPQTGFFDDELVALLEKLAMNLSFALDNFQRDDARRSAEAALRQSETRFRDFAAAAGEYVWEADLEGRMTYISSRVQSVWGYSDQELTGRRPAEYMPPGEAERVREWIRHNLRPDGSFNDLEHMIFNRQGETRWLLINAVGLFDAAGNRVGQRGTGRDITDRKNAEERISYLATRDPLTELPNRVLFNDRLGQGIVAARRTGQSLALLFIDLDPVQEHQRLAGPSVGDLLLKESGQPDARLHPQGRHALPAGR